jgi:hypothetical protein
MTGYAAELADKLQSGWTKVAPVDNNTLALASNDTSLVPDIINIQFPSMGAIKAMTSQSTLSGWMAKAHGFPDIQNALYDRQVELGFAK